MATLWHVGDVIEVICEFDDSPTHLTTLRRISWSFHQAVENVWTLLLGRQNSVIAVDQLKSIVLRYVLPFHGSGHDFVRSVRAALTALRHTVTSFALSSHWAHGHMSGLIVQLVEMPQLQSAKFLGHESLLELTAQFGTATQLEALLDRCPHLLSNTPDKMHTYDPPLLCTARSGNLECALVLLQHGSDPTVEDVNGNTITHIAWEHGLQMYLEGISNAGYDVS
jgi:ankyrin repeat protein